MKKILFCMLMLILLFSLSVNAARALHTECRDFGFDLGIARWKFNKTAWIPVTDSLGTSVTGNNTEAAWNVGTFDDFGATGIVVKTGKKYYSIIGDSDIIVAEKIGKKIDSIKYITFCFKFEPCGPGG